MALVSMAVCPPALAGDWSLESTISEKVDFNDNYGMNEKSNGVVLGSITDVYGDLIYLTRDSRFDLIADIVARKYWGPGDEDVVDGILPRFESRYHQDFKRGSFDLGTYYAEQEISGNDTLDVDERTPPSTKRNFGGNFGFGRIVGRRDNLYWANSVAQTLYEDNSRGTDNQSLDSSLTWTRRLTKRVDRKLTAGVNYLTYDNAGDVEKVIYRSRADFTAILSPRLKANAGGGVNLINSFETITPTPPLTPYRDSNLDYGLSADAGFDYQLKTTTISGYARYGLSQGTFGELQTQASVGLSIAERINERSTVSLTATAKMVTSDTSGIPGIGGNNGSGGSHGFSVSSLYKVDLTDEWELQAGYKWTLKQTDKGIPMSPTTSTATSNDVFLQLTRNFVVFP